MHRDRERNTLETLSDEALVAAARAGDKTAFGALITRYMPLVRGVVRRMTGDDLLAHDLAQEAMLRAYLSLDSLRDPARFRSWLYGIARHTCLMHLRVHRIRTISLDDPGGTARDASVYGPSPEEALQRLELRRVVMQAVETLPAASREAVLLFYFENFDLQETAAALGISTNTAKGRLHRARSQLRQHLSTFEPLRKDKKTMIPVRLIDVFMLREARGEGNSVTHCQLILMNEERRRAFVIWVGEYEGLAIFHRLNGSEFNRPLTQQFIARLLAASGAALERVEISELKDDVFYATVSLNVNGAAQQIDARPSDAIGLALYNNAPLYASEQVLERIGFDVPVGQHPTGAGLAGIRAVLEALHQAELEYGQQMASRSEEENALDRTQKAQDIAARAFAAGG